MVKLTKNIGITKIETAAPVSAPLSQTITWTALPNGVSPNYLNLSVYVSPRLQSEAVAVYLPGGTIYAPPSLTLSQFPDFIDWPSSLPSADKWTVEFSPDKNFPPSSTVKVTSANGLNPILEDPLGTVIWPDSAIWKKVFNDSIRVEPYVFDDYQDRIIRSYPVKEVFSFLKRAYQAAATKSPNDLPSIKTLWEAEGFHFRQIRFDQPPRKQPYGELRNTMKRALGDFLSAHDKKAFPPPTSSNEKLEVPTAQGTVKLNTAAFHFLQAEIFHSPLNEIDPKTKQVNRVLMGSDYNRDRIDFHRMLSILSQYPYLLRRLGLVIEFQIPIVAIPIHGGYVRVCIPSWSPKIKTVDYTPGTYYKFDGNIFVAESYNHSTSDLSDGMLKINSPSFTVVQVDVDGAAMKAMNFSNSLNSMLEKPVPDTPGEAGLPSLRSSGISIVKIGRACGLHDALVSAANKNSALKNFEKSGPSSSNLVPLYAEDLVRGYRLDIWDNATGKWHSTCKRDGRYTLAGAQLPPHSDEGYVKTAATKAADKSETSDLYLHESLIHWEGWSLCAPRPGTAIESPDQFPNSQVALGLATSFAAAKNSLPRLRFGVNYRFRARAVDLAGNSWRPDDPAVPKDYERFLDSEGKQTPYLRFEPVSAPALVLRWPLNTSDQKDRWIPPSPGESLERMVIRSKNDKEDEPITADLNEKYADGYTSERHVAPPKTSQIMAELHGMFDGPPPTGGWYSVATTRDGNLTSR